MASTLAFGASAQDERPVRFGIIADPHADLMPDHMERLSAFMESVEKNQPDFILQLGDFCFPKESNRPFLSLWRQFRGPRFHVLGNHDMDVSSKQETIDFWEMKSRYYSVDVRGLHLVILDANNMRAADGSFIPYERANFYVDDSLRTFIDAEQLAWLKADLDSTALPVVVFSHQSLSSPCWGIKNRVAVQRILEAKNADSSEGKVLACFNGHDHIDYHRTINEIHYIEVNSMAYQWVGANYSNKTRYSPSLYEQYPNLDKMAPYRDPLFAFVTIDLQQKKIRIEGQTSDWLAPTPTEMGITPGVEGCQLSPHIIDRVIKL